MPGSEQVGLLPLDGSGGQGLVFRASCRCGCIFIPALECTWKRILFSLEE